MNWLQTVILGMVQGITEFLPISSSGHLVVTEALFDQAGQPLADLLEVEIALHAGTLVTILIYFRRQIVRLLGQDRRAVGLLIVGTMPAVVFGLTAKEFAEAWLESAWLAGGMLPMTGGMLLWSARHEDTTGKYNELSYAAALVVGCFQAFAILPGISRSGSTIVGGLAMGLSRRDAATFSFLLAIPAIGGACLLEVLDILQEGASSTPMPMLVAGAVTACLTGFVALYWLLSWLLNGRLHHFAYWCFGLGACVLIWQAVRLVS